MSHFQYRPRGPVIHYLNNQLIGAVLEAFLLQAPQARRKRSGEARTDVHFFPISRADVQDEIARESLYLGTMQRQLEKRREINRGAVTDLRAMATLSRKCCVWVHR